MAPCRSAKTAGYGERPLHILPENRRRFKFFVTERLAFVLVFAKHVPHITQTHREPRSRRNKTGSFCFGQKLALLSQELTVREG
jgi:hypothetical protein